LSLATLLEMSTYFIATSVNGQSHAIIVDGKIVATFDTLAEAVAERKRLERGSAPKR